MVDKQVVGAMERSEAGTSVYLRQVNVPPDVFLPHQDQSLKTSSNTFVSIFAIFFFLVLSVSLRHSLQSSWANCLDKLYNTRSFTLAVACHKTCPRSIFYVISIALTVSALH